MLMGQSYEFFLGLAKISGTKNRGTNLGDSCQGCVDSIRYSAAYIPSTFLINEIQINITIHV
jgi:hypothetical protein